MSGGRVFVVFWLCSDGMVEFIGEVYVYGIMNGEVFKIESCIDVRIRWSEKIVE